MLARPRPPHPDLGVRVGRRGPPFAWLVLCGMIVAGCAGAPGGMRSDPPQLVGRTGQYTVLEPVQAVRPVAFSTGDGGRVDLGDFRGKVVLLNFWATWCPPCVEELPSLDRLQATLGGEDFAVVAVAIDRAGLSSVAPFYRRYAIEHLDMYLDPDQRIAHRSAENPNDAQFPLYGLPITYLVDAQGMIRGYVTGAVDWMSPQAHDLLTYYIADDDDCPIDRLARSNASVAGHGHIFLWRGGQANDEQ